MKKKEYISPAFQVIEMNTTTYIAVSGGEGSGGSSGGGISKEEWDSWGPGFGSNDPNYPGEGV